MRAGRYAIVALLLIPAAPSLAFDEKAYWDKEIVEQNARVKARKDADTAKVAAYHARVAKQDSDYRALCVKTGKPEVGFTGEAAIKTCWGKPQRINTTKTAEHTYDQWVYVGGFLNFTDGVVTSVQTSR